MTRLYTLVSVVPLLIAMSAAIPSAGAAEWPSKPVTLVVPFPPGGSSDVVGRLIAERLGARLGQQFVVENRAGAGGNVGTDSVAKAAPDGYRLALSTSGPLANNKHLYRKLPFDAARDLTPIALVGVVPLVFAANPTVKAATLRAFFEDAKRERRTPTIGNPGNGTIGHLAAALVQSELGVDATNVAYKGDTPAMVDLIGGTIDVVCAPVTAFVPNIRSGKLKALAVTSKQRFGQLPDVPTAAEQGVDLDATLWFAIVGPAGMASPVVERLNREINAVLAMADVRERMETFGIVATGGTAAQLGEQMATDSAKWKKVIDAVNITLD